MLIYYNDTWNIRAAFGTGAIAGCPEPSQVQSEICETNVKPFGDRLLSLLVINLEVLVASCPTSLRGKVRARMAHYRRLNLRLHPSFLLWRCFAPESRCEQPTNQCNPKSSKRREFFFFNQVIFACLTCSTCYNP